MCCTNARTSPPTLLPWCCITGRGSEALLHARPTAATICHALEGSSRADMGEWGEPARGGANGAGTSMLRFDI
eukprot:1158101-Pelagomonas_calceolata.AAC.7